MFDFFDINFIYNLSKFLLSLLFGSLVFFASIIAPTIFMTLDQSNARKLIRAIFPRLYIWGFIISITIAIIHLYQISFITFTAFMISLGFILSRQILMPKINKASDIAKKNIETNSNFKRLHSLSVVIFIIQLFLILFLYFYL